MRRPGYAIVLCLLWLAAAGCARVDPGIRPSPPPALTLITWNMDAGRGDLPALVGERVRGPYVLLLQEADETAVRQFAARDGASLFFSPVRPDVPGSRGNAIVSTLPLENTQRIDLPQERQPRSAVAADVVLGGQRLFVVSAHLENRVSWWRGGLFSEDARGRQARALVERLPAGPGIVGGDMNTWLGVHEPAWRALLGRFPDTPDARHAPTFRDRLVLDHLFFDLPDGWSAEVAVVADRYGSDHHPVRGEVDPSYITATASAGTP
jgi:endonuclease/exonuclease/phosphatase family metal-dependent hydrolase